MAHTHDHAHDHGTHYIDQLCSVAVAGTLGMIAIVLWMQGSLTILAPFFQSAVMGGGMLLLTIAVIRGVILWQEVGRPKPAAHDHGHDHDHDCGHEHHHDHEHGPGCVHHTSAMPAPSPALPDAEPENNHGHDHDHGWAPVRYAVLLLPIALFFLGLPNANPENPRNFNKVYNDMAVKRAIGDLPSLLGVWFFGQTPSDEGQDLDLAASDVQGVRGQVMGIGFKELAQAAADPTLRPGYEGKTVSLKGQFVRLNDPKSFRLVRMKMTCCYADAIPLNAIIASPEPVGDIPYLQWVQVTGVVQFRTTRDGTQVFPVLQLESREKDIQYVQPDLTPVQ